MDGDHDIARCADVTQWVLKEVFEQLFVADVQLEGIMLKPNMVIAGKKCPKQNSVEEVARATVKILKDCVPSAVPGIAFLSGGQSDEDATAHLSAINAIGNLPWAVTFSYGRALQAAPQAAWSGKAENDAAGQAAFAHRALMNSLAATGKWKAVRREEGCLICFDAQTRLPCARASALAWRWLYASTPRRRGRKPERA